MQQDANADTPLPRTGDTIARRIRLGIFFALCMVPPVVIFGIPLLDRVLNR